MSISDRYARRVNRPYVDFLRRLGLDFEPSEALGAVVKDRAGRQYVDCIGGYGNLNIGHNHPQVVEALRRALQSGRPSGWPFISQDQVELTERLAELAPAGLDRCLVVNSGAEAVDSALKLVRLATGRSGVICCRGAWHGFTMGALSVSEPDMCRSFAPLLPSVHHIPYGDTQAAAEAISSEIGAIIVEPIQAESGALVPPRTYLTDLANICAASNALLIVDEIKTGMGKTGEMFACEYDGAEPDVLLVGKSLGAGIMPIGAMLARERWWAKFGLSFPMSSSSGAGNALACAAGVATIDVIRYENLCANAKRQGQRLRQALVDLSAAFPDLIRGVSGRGLLLGLHAVNRQIAHGITVHCLRYGVLMMPAFLDRACILIEPPLCIDEGQVDSVLRALQAACSSIGAPSRDARLPPV